jgi:hypothetical protein
MSPPRGGSHSPPRSLAGARAHKPEMWRARETRGSGVEVVLPLQYGRCLDRLLAPSSLSTPHRPTGHQPPARSASDRPPQDFTRYPACHCTDRICLERRAPTWLPHAWAGVWSTCLSGPSLDADLGDVQADRRLHRGERCTSIDNFVDYWECELRLEAILPLDSRRCHPVHIGDKCVVPLQAFTRRQAVDNVAELVAQAPGGTVVFYRHL